MVHLPRRPRSAAPHGLALLSLAALIGCSVPTVKAPDPEDSGEPQHTGELEDSGQTGDTGDSGDSGDETPCTPMAALFFDLGETLVVERSDGLFEPRDGAVELLEALVAQGMPIGVVTNVPRGYDLDDLRALLAEPSMLEYFDIVLMSSQADAGPKPDPDIFLEAVATLPDPPPVAQTAFVTEELDDLSDGDPPTEGAMAAGMIGVHLSDEAPSPLVDHTVATDALPSIATAAWLSCIEAE